MHIVQRASDRVKGHSMIRFGSTAKALAKFKLEYYRISECTGALHVRGVKPFDQVHVHVQLHETIELFPAVALYRLSSVAYQIHLHPQLTRAFSKGSELIPRNAMHPSGTCQSMSWRHW